MNFAKLPLRKENDRICSTVNTKTRLKQRNRAYSDTVQYGILFVQSHSGIFPPMADEETSTATFLSQNYRVLELSISVDFILLNVLSTQYQCVTGRLVSCN